MAYIGNGRTLLIFAPNVRDDIIPNGVDSTFELSQEVPGGYEGNIIVLRKRYIIDEILAPTGQGGVLSLVAPNTFFSGVADAQAFSIIQPPLDGNDASNLIITGSGLGNDGIYRIDTVSYDTGLNGIGINLVTSAIVNENSNASLQVVWGHTTDWEVLEPEIDYVVGGDPGPDYNKLITFGGGYVPSVDDQIYVIHRGEATYNFTPTAATVGPDQLQQNLRNFVCDRFTTVAPTSAFALSQFAVNAKTLLVTVNGVPQDGDDTDQAFVGDYELDTNGLGITFHSPVAASAKVRILHLGFSTVSRRATLSPGQAAGLAPNVVTNAALAANSVTTDKIAPGGVTHTDVAVDSIEGDQLLLRNNQSIRGEFTTLAVNNLLLINTANETVLLSEASMPFVINGQGVQIRLNDGSVEPEVHNDIALGSISKRFKELFVQGTTRLGATEVDSLDVNGNASVDGNILLTTPGATVDGVDLTLLASQVAALIANPEPTGIMKMWMVDGAPPTGYLICNGAAVSRTTYSALFTTIGTTFGVGDGSTTFNVPDLRQRFPLGKAASGTGSLWGNINGVGGNIDHTHTGGAHTHDMSNHTHSIPGHYHAMGSGADLTISASGTHTTSIQHNHAAFTTGGSDGYHDHNLDAGPSGAYAHSNLEGINSAHYHGPGSLSTNSASLNHRHYSNFNTGTESNYHTHSGSTNSDGTHTHSDNDTRSNDNGTSPINKIRITGSAGSGAGAWTIDSTGSSHSHAFTTGNNNLLHVHGVSGYTDYQDLSHSHSVNGGTTSTDGAHQHRIKGRIYNYESNHAHSIDIPDTGAINSISDGSHSHSSGSFSGRIGQVSGGSDGNASFASGVPSAANTGSAGATVTTSSNPPFHTVHFIIKT